MYRYIKSSSATRLTLDAVILVADVEKASIGVVFASDNAYVADFSNMSDEELVALGKDAISYIEDLPTIIRIGKIDSELLTFEQKKLVKEFGENRLVSQKITVEELIRAIRACSAVQFVSDRSATTKNSEFIRDHSGLSIIDVVKSLEISDYVETRVGGDYGVFCHDLFVFTKAIEYESDDGNNVENLTLYIKLDKDQTDGTTVALVSLHETDHDSIVDKPYMFD